MFYRLFDALEDFFDRVGWANVILLVVAVALAGIRIAGHKSLTFQAVAHGFVGGLMVAGAGFKSWYYRGLWIGLTVVETICFTVGKVYDLSVYEAIERLF